MRISHLTALVATLAFSPSFTAQEPPLASPAAPIPLPVARPQEVPIRLEFRAGKNPADHRILLKRDGFEIEAIRVRIGPAAIGLVATTSAEGMIVQTQALTTVCQSIEIRPNMMGSHPGELPSWNGRGEFRVSHVAAGRADAECGGFRFEFTKLTLVGAKNRLEIVPGSHALNLKTKDAEIRGTSTQVGYESGVSLTLTVATSDEKGLDNGKIRLVQH